MSRKGDFLRHRSKSEWGTRMVMSISGDKIQNQFAHAPVTLRLDIAGALFEEVEARRGF